MNNHQYPTYNPQAVAPYANTFNYSPHFNNHTQNPAGKPYFNPFDDSAGEQKTNVIIHHVKDGDSLMNLSLNYGVSSAVIRKFNGLTSDDIYYLKEISIPNPKKSMYPPPPEEEEKQRIATLRQAFKNRTGETNEKTITEFLTKSNFNYNHAVDEYEAGKANIEKRKKAILSLKYKLEREDQDDKFAEYYLSMCDWDVGRAFEEYKLDLAGCAEAIKGKGVKGPNKNDLYPKMPQQDYYAPLARKNPFEDEGEEESNRLIQRNDINTHQKRDRNLHVDRFTFDVSKKDK